MEYKEPRIELNDKTIGQKLQGLSEATNQKIYHTFSSGSEDTLQKLFTAIQKSKNEDDLNNKLDSIIAGTDK